MKRKNPPLVTLLCAFLISTVILSSMLYNALGTIQSHASMSSYGVINYSTTLTPTPTPTPTPNPTSSANAIWMKVIDLSTANLDKLIEGNIKHIFLEVGEWRTDGSINYFYSTATYQNFINQAKARNPNFLISARVYAVPPWQSSVDISSDSKRQVLINSAVQCVQTIGFDGFNEDIEGYIGSSQNLVDYWNGLAAAMRSIGKITSVDALCHWAYPVEQIYPYLNVDYVCPMLYNDATFGSSDFKGIMDRVLKQSASPVLISGYPTIALSNILNWIDEQIASGGPYSKLAGFSWWEFRDLSAADWDAWNNWKTKDT